MANETTKPSAAATNPAEKPVEATKPAETKKPTEAAKPVDTKKPEEAKKPEPATKPAEAPKKPAEVPKQAEEVKKPAEAKKPAEEAKLEEATAAVKPEQPEEADNSVDTLEQDMEATDPDESDESTETEPADANNTTLDGENIVTFRFIPTRPILLYPIPNGHALPAPIFSYLSCEMNISEQHPNFIKASGVVAGRGIVHGYISINDIPKKVIDELY